MILRIPAWWKARGRDLAMALLYGGLLVGGLEAAVLEPALWDTVRAFFAGGILTALCFALFFPAAVVATELARWGSRHSGFSSRFEDGLGVENRSRPAAEGSRASVILFYAALTASLLVAGAGLLAVVALILALQRVTEPAELVRAGVLGTGLIIVGSLAAWGVVAGLARSVLSWLDNKWGLPRPRRSWFFLLLSLPSFILCAIIHEGTTVPELRLATLVVATFSIALALNPVAVRLSKVRHFAAFSVGFFSMGLSATLFTTAVDPASLALMDHPTLVRLMVQTSGLRPAEDDAETESAPIQEGPELEYAPLKISSGHLKKKQVKRYNVVWLMVDTLRADRMQLYGHERKTTPYLEEISDDFIVFERAHAQATGTNLSVASMLAGKNPGNIVWRRGVDTRRTMLAKETRSVAELFSDAGYRTTASMDGFIVKIVPESFKGFGNVRQVRSRDEYLPAVLDIFHDDPKISRDATKKPFFLFGHFIGAHSPYGSGDVYGHKPLDQYDEAVKRTDEELKGFLEHLRMHPKIWQNTIVVIHSDHGEEFGEHGGRFHASSCHGELTHVPLMIRIPGFKGRRVDSLVANVDIVPTLLELTGFDPTALGGLDGQSLLVPYFDKEVPPRSVLCLQKDKEKHGPVYASARGDGWLYTTNVGGGRQKLFSTATDPTEQRNLFKSHHGEAIANALVQSVTENQRGNFEKVW